MLILVANFQRESKDLPLVAKGQGPQGAGERVAIRLFFTLASEDSESRQ